MTAEDEEFNRIEMESRIKQEYVRAMRKKVGDDFDAEYAKTMTGLMDELAVARMLIRELGDRLARIEAGNMRNDVIEEVAKEIEKFTAFGTDTVQSFAVYIRGMKT
jgi:ATP-dependent Lon protease